MNIDKKLSELKKEAKGLLQPIPLRVFLEAIANRLETEYSEHKNLERWKEEVSGFYTSNEGERDALYLSWLMGPFNDLIHHKIATGDSKESQLSMQEQKHHLDQIFYLCAPIRWLTPASELTKKYGWELRQSDDVFEVRPSNQHAEKAVMDSIRDSKVFNLFGSMGRNIQKVNNYDPHAPEDSFNRLIEEEKTFYPKDLFPAPGKTITEYEIQKLAESEVYRRLVETNMLDFYEFLAPGASRGADDIILKLPLGDLGVSDAIKIIVLICLMARIQVAQIDRYVMSVLRIHRNHRSDIQKRLNDLGTLSSYNIEELATWIAKAIGMDVLTVKKTFSILDYVRGAKIKHAYLNFQTLFCVKGNIHWLPNSLAYTSTAELLFNTIIGQELVRNKQQISNITERAVLSWFRGAGFKVIKDDDHEYGDQKGKPLGDFDALAYKNGHLYHLEIKLTYIRNNLIDKMKFKDSKVHKARKQLSQGRKYILENKDEISKRLGLKPNEEIIDDKFHSYLVSNSFDFDKQKIGGYLKFTLKELYIALYYASNLMFHNDEVLLRHQVLSFKHHLNAPLPAPFIDWYEGKENFPENCRGQFFNYQQFHIPKLKEALHFKSTHPLWAIDNNWYTLRDKLHIDPIRYFEFELDGQKISLPEV